MYVLLMDLEISFKTHSMHFDSLAFVYTLIATYFKSIRFPSLDDLAFNEMPFITVMWIVLRGGRGCDINKPQASKSIGE